MSSQEENSSGAINSVSCSLSEKFYNKILLGVCLLILTWSIMWAGFAFCYPAYRAMIVFLCISCSLVLGLLVVAFKKPEITGFNGSFNLLFALSLVFILLFYFIQFADVEKFVKNKNLLIQYDKTVVRLENKEKTVDKMIADSDAKLMELTEFQNLFELWANAESDHRPSYDNIKKLAFDTPNYKYQGTAARMLRSIEDKYQFNSFSSHTVMWDNIFWLKDGVKQAVNPADLSLEDFKEIYNQAEFDGIAVSDIIKKMALRQDFSQKQKMEFLIDIVKNGQSLSAVKVASDIINKEAKLIHRGFKIDEILLWYEKNKMLFE